jgi:hypothetical protein
MMNYGKALTDYRRLAPYHRGSQGADSVSSASPPSLGRLPEVPELGRLPEVPELGQYEMTLGQQLARLLRPSGTLVGQTEPAEGRGLTVPLTISPPDGE